MKETDAIAAVRAAARSSPGDGVVLGIGDDAAVLEVVGGDAVVACVDTLNLGTHFAEDHPPRELGHKALAVNLSDLAAMGARPRWALLSLSAPEVDGRWLDAVLSGFMDLASRHRLALVGGDTARGPLSLSVTALGLAHPGKVLRRGTASAGDRIWVSGVLGDASLALAGLGGEQARRRLLAPEPRVALGQALAGIASGCIDVSDGLRADLPRLLGDGLGAQLRRDALPCSRALRSLLASEPSHWRHALVGGDDYELLFTVDRDLDEAVRQAARTCQVPVTAIGEVEAEPGIRCVDASGAAVDLDAMPGFEHFP